MTTRALWTIDRQTDDTLPVVLAACAILLILTGLFLTGRFPQEPLRRAIESRLQAGLGAGSSVGSVRIVPGRLQIELRDLVLVGPTYTLTVPRAFVVAKMDFILGRSLAFRVVQAESPHLTLRPSPTASKLLAPHLRTSGAASLTLPAPGGRGFLRSHRSSRWAGGAAW